MYRLNLKRNLQLEDEPSHLHSCWSERWPFDWRKGWLESGQAKACSANGLELRKCLSSLLQKQVLSNMCRNEVPAYEERLPTWFQEEAHKAQPETAKTAVETSEMKAAENDDCFGPEWWHEFQPISSMNSFGSPKLHHIEWYFLQKTEDSAQLGRMDDPKGELDHGFHCGLQLQVWFPE